MRQFTTGATRDTDEGKLDFEGFLSPTVLERYAAYMHKNRIQADGQLRDSDNWQKGIPREAYMKSGWRHFFAWWKAWRRGENGTEDACALLFNVMGWLHETLKKEETLGSEWTAVVPEWVDVAQVREEVTIADEDGRVRRFVEVFEDESIEEDSNNLHAAATRVVKLARSYGVTAERLGDLMGSLAAKEEWR